MLWRLADDLFSSCLWDNRGLCNLVKLVVYFEMKIRGNIPGGSVKRRIKSRTKSCKEFSHNDFYCSTPPANMFGTLIPQKKTGCFVVNNQHNYRFFALFAFFFVFILPAQFFVVVGIFSMEENSTFMHHFSPRPIFLKVCQFAKVFKF